ncbi:MAG: hypothetical protein L6R48_08430 [Planctomycetes bacterium]|nr:hypothetical protein [Planctomycetota bacterium]
MPIRRPTAVCRSLVPGLLALLAGLPAAEPAGPATGGGVLPAVLAGGADSWYRAAGFGREAGMLPTGERVVAGIRFHIPAVPHLLADGAVLDLPLPADGSARHLYLLHSADGPTAAAGAVGGIEVLDAMGSATAVIPLLGGQDVGPWRAATHQLRAVAAWKQPVTREGASPRNQATTWVGWYVTRFALPAEARALRLRAAAGARWLVAAAATSREAVEPLRSQERTATADADWRPLAANLAPLAASALDLSALLDAPAGRHGPVGVRDGRLAFADGTRARFAGLNLTAMFPEMLAVGDERLEELAERFARMGVNLVRVSHLDSRIRRDADGRPGLEPVQLERFDRLVAALKRRGIYLTVELAMSGGGEYAITRARFGGATRETYQSAVFVEPDFLADLQEWARLFLTHVNPHTGLAYAEEPALAFVGMNNEDCLPTWLGAKEQERLPAALRASFARAFATHLRGSYPDQAALAAAWGTALAGDDDLAQAVAVDLARDGRRRQDTLGFLAALHLRGWQAMDRHLRGLGLAAPLTDANFTTNPAITLLRSQLPLVDTHGYFDHRKWGREQNTLPLLFTQRALVRPQHWWSRDLHLRLAASRHAGRPFTVSEYDACYPNRHRAETGVVLGGMAALQDWDGLMQFTYGSVPESVWEPGYHAKTFDLATDPIRQAAEIQLRLLFLRGDLRPAPDAVEVAAGRDEVLAGALDGLVEADLLPFVTRVGRRVGARSATGAAVLAAGAGEAGTLPRATGDQPAALAAWFAAVKPRILPADNPSDAGRGLLVAATGELTWDFARERVLLDTPLSRGAVVKKAGDIRVTGLEAHLDAGAAAFTVHSLDREPIERSRRLLVILATDALTTGLHSEQDGKLVYAWGSGPMLLRAGSARISLARARTMGAWALDTAGRRVAPLAVSHQDGRLTLELDQRRQASIFWELAEEEGR